MFKETTGNIHNNYKSKPMWTEDRERILFFIYSFQGLLLVSQKKYNLDTVPKPKTTNNGTQ